MNERHQTMLEMLCRESTYSLFETMGFTLAASEYGATRPAGRGFASSVGYTAGSARGALTLRATDTLVASTRPAELGPATSEEALADWAGELSNQLLGRIKNRLLRHGLEIQLSTPIVVRGQDLRQSRSSASHVVLQAFHQGDAAMSMCFEIDGDFVLEDESPETESPYVEGDVALF